jgi:DNA-binding transcriptional LysR family regulator
MKRSEHVSRRMKLQHLRIFLAVAQTGGMAKAAKHLATSQSVVSKAVSELEDILGVPLFERSSRGVEPTLYGRTLLKGGNAIFDDLRTSVGEIEFLANSGVGELRIGTTEAQAALANAAMIRLSRKHPRIDFKVVSLEERILVEELRARRIDLLVGPTRSDHDLHSTFLYDMRQRIVVGIKNPWSRRRKITLSDLVGEAWCVAPIDTPPGAAFAEAFRLQGLPMPRIVASTTMTHERRRWIADGGVVGVLGDGALHFDIRGPPLKILPVDLAARPVKISIVTLKSRIISPAVSLFIEYAREVTEQLRNGQGPRYVPIDT